ncbi:MAG TPA: MFS transporter [Vineibacter sp.]|nr:MFS transporter [Vineibacter sp.]
MSLTTSAGRLDSIDLSTSRRRWWALIVVVAAQFMFVVDAFIVNVAIPSIQADLRAGAAEIEAILAVYQIAFATLVITGGRLGDIGGRKRMFMVGVLAFSTASLWCGLAGSGVELILGRLAQGAAAALMVPQVLATIHTLFPDAARGRAFAVYGTALGLGAAAGFVLGGWLVTLDVAGLGWRSVFLVNIPIGVAIALAAWRLMPATQPQAGTQLDVAGAVVLFLGLIGVIGPVMAGHDLGWTWWLWLLMAAGGTTLMLFLRLQRAIKHQGGQPLIDPSQFTDRAFVSGLCAAFCFHLGNTSFYLVMTLFMQNGLRFSPLEGGLAVMPLALAFTLASHIATRRQAQVGNRVLLEGTAVQFAGLLLILLLVAIVERPGLATLMAALTVFGVRQGLVMAPLAGVVLSSVPRIHAGAGAGLLSTATQAAGAAGISLAGAIYFAGRSVGTERDGACAALAVLGVTIVATAVLLIWSQRVRASQPPPAA